jgi:hypothetical protein
MKLTIFLSYARADREAAALIVDLLRRRGIDCWVDQEGILPGTRYDREIERAIRRSGAVVWLVSSNSVLSDYVKFEVMTACHHHKPILPVRLEPIDLADLPAPLNLKLGNVQAWDYFAASAEDLGAGLADGLRAMVLRDRRKFLGRVGASVAGLGVVVGSLSAWGLVRSGDGPGAVVPPPHSIPPKLAGLPFGEVMRVAYTEAPPAPASGRSRAALQVEIQARRRGEREFTALRDGEALASRADDYRIIAKALSPGFLYLFQVDAMGKVDWLFPRNETSAASSGSNPLEVGQSIRVPGSDSGASQSLYLDTTVGVEHVYAVFSATRWPRLEQALARSLPIEEEATAGAVAMRGVIDEPSALGLRGVGGVRKDAPTAGGLNPPPVGDRFQGESYFLVLERWFRHVAPG